MSRCLVKLLTSSAAVALLSGAAAAADLPVPYEPPVLQAAPAPAPAFSWTGLALGVQGGYAWGDAEATFNNGAPTLNYDPDGWIAGGYVGLNYQWNTFVLGVEGDIEWTDIEGAAASAAGATSRGSIDVNFQASLRARAGIAMDRFLAYVTGGAAYADVDVTGGPIAGPLGAYSDDNWGWTVGGGVEYAFMDNFVGGIEYRYTDFGEFSGNLAPPFPGINETVDLQTHAIRGRLGYKF